MSDFTDHQLVSGMRRLNGQIATPSGFSRELRKAIVDQDLMRFKEWPSGHWAVTPKGRAFLADYQGDGA